MKLLQILTWLYDMAKAIKAGTLSPTKMLATGFILGLLASIAPGSVFTKYVSGITQKWSYNQGRKDGRQECKEAAPDKEKDGRWFRFFAREEQPSGLTGMFIEDHVEVEQLPPEIIDHPTTSEGDTLEAPR